MSQTFRHPEILDIARTNGKVTVDGLADHFGVTQQTIRRDLKDLTDEGKLERVHGGAVLPSGTTNIKYEERRALNMREKSVMARACASRVPDNISLFVNLGTTTEAVARELIHHRNLMLVTNNMRVANILIQNESCQIIMTGGSLRRSDGGLVGSIAEAAILQFKFDLAIISCSALDQDGDILDFDVQEVSVSRAIIRQSRKVILVADHTKFARSAPAKIASLADVDIFVTDRTLPDPLLEACARWKTDVVVASDGGA